MKNNMRIFFSMAMLIAGITAQAQTYNFPTVYSPASCTYTYELTTTVHLDSVQVTNIYYDDGTTGSFAFEAFISYENVFVNSTLPTGNFYTYSITVYSENPNLSSNNLTNNIGTVPLITYNAGGLASQNNPTYNGSASAMGLTLGQAISSPSVLNQLGYDSATILIGLPCMDTTVQADSIIPLPILWSKLLGQNIGNQITLSWQTFMEQNTAGFDIERSSDATHWSTIGTKPSNAKNGNSNIPLSYSFKCQEIMEGTYYYRIVHKETDGKSVVSNIVRMAIGGSKDDLQIYPNPAKTALYISGIPDLSDFTINDLAGKSILKGRYSKYIDLTGLQSGIYLLTCQGKHTKLMIK